MIPPLKNIILSLSIIVSQLFEFWKNKLNKRVKRIMLNLNLYTMFNCNGYLR